MNTEINKNSLTNPCDDDRDIFKRTPFFGIDMNQRIIFTSVISQTRAFKRENVKSTIYYDNC